MNLEEEEESGLMAQDEDDDDDDEFEAEGKNNVCFLSLSQFSLSLYKRVLRFLMRNAPPSLLSPQSHSTSICLLHTFIHVISKCLLHLTSRGAAAQQVGSGDRSAAGPVQKVLRHPVWDPGVSLEAAGAPYSQDGGPHLSVGCPGRGRICLLHLLLVQ